MGKVTRKVKSAARRYYARFLAEKFQRRAAAEGKRFFFTVVIPVYNTEEYLAEAVDSVLTQSTGLRCIQVILVNDGSQDGSEKICLDYQKRFPNNVKYISQPNAGVSAARNRGIEASEGVYLTFLDSDDKWERQSFFHVMQYLEKFNFPDVVAARMNFFDARKGPHMRNYCFEEDRILDFRTDYQAMPINGCQAFYKRTAIGDKRFMVGLRHAEDPLFAFDVTLETQSYGAMTKPLRLYRKRAAEDSVSDTIVSDPYYYTEALDMYHDTLIKRSMEKFGTVPRYVQHMLLYNIAWRLREQPAHHLHGAPFLPEYREHLVRILKVIEDDVIADERVSDLWQKLYAVSLKYGEPYSRLLDTLECSGDDLTCVAGGQRVPVSRTSLMTHICRIDFITPEEDTGTLMLEGTIPGICLSPEKVRMQFLCNGTSVVPELYPRRHSSIHFAFDDADTKLYQLHFRAVVPLEDTLGISAEYAFACGEDTPLQKMELSFGLFSRLHRGFDGANYSLHDGRLYKCRDSVLYVEKADESVRQQYEDALEKVMASKPTDREWIGYRKYALEHLHDEKKLWLFTDRMTSAEDSGEEMFRYLIDHPVPNVETAFIIRDDVPDFERLSKIGRVIPYNSEEHLKALLRADMLISSAADREITDPFLSNDRFIRDLLHFDFVFLQHGVIKDDLSDWLNRMSKDIRLFVTSSERERRSILEGPYGYDEDRIILTGLPRFDKLKRGDRVPTENAIYIMPTWREWLAPKFNINAESADRIQTKRSDFLDTRYFKFYNGLLSSPRLRELAEKHDLQVYFALHPRMGAQMEEFYSDDRIHLLKPETFVYGNAFKEMKALVTDYSSVAFNVALLKKPVIYAQFDFEDFYLNGLHTADPGYFSFEDDGFGPVVRTADEVLDELEKVVERGCTMDGTYLKRVDDFFFTPPPGVTHCELVLNAILGLKKHSREA